MEVAELLIQNCAGLNLKNKEDEETPLHIAAKRGRTIFLTTTTALLLFICFGYSVITRLNHNYLGNTEMIKLLIKSGAQVDAVNRRRHTAYDLADREIDHLLRGVETVSDKRPGCSALHEAVAEGKTIENVL